jgi:uncharacterized protein (DUF433 family)
MTGCEVCKDLMGSMPEPTDQAAVTNRPELDSLDFGDSELMDNVTTIQPTLLGVGLYTTRDAAVLTGVPSPRVRRWMARYTHGRQDAPGRSGPLWTPQSPRTGQDIALGFRDLMELRFVARFLAVGISLQSIRRALAIGREVVGDERPFSTARFRTDGRQIFLQVSREAEEPTLIDIVNRQYAFHRMIEPSFRDIDFGDGVPERWWPMSHRSQVVLDPLRNFGQPMVADQGVPTRAIADAVAVEGSAAKVAKLFELPPTAVRDALAFERRAA